MSHASDIPQQGVIMVQGTTSDAGKSTLCVALCRYLRDQGFSVAPFKPQNMALNSAVTENGGEIGRAQALQAVAAGVEAHTDMNPILLKPNSDQGSQVIVNGKAIGNMDAAQYHAEKPHLLPKALEAFNRLKAQYDWIVIEGAGSPAEVNLRENDIANMGFAEAVDCPVILVADIDRGGVFAHVVGTIACLSESEQQRISGFVINRFRGDISLLKSGLDWLERETDKPVFGVLPYLKELKLDAEDSLSRRSSAAVTSSPFRIVIIALPRISNHTDFDALADEADVSVSYVREAHELYADLIIIPGSKSVRQDLAWLRAQGLEAGIQRHIRLGGKIIGICGGYQMLGQVLADPLGIEGEPGASDGLGYLPIDTQLEPEKVLEIVSGKLSLPGGIDSQYEGYEIHAGVTRHQDTASLLIVPDQKVNRDPGCISSDNAVLGCYIHGLFDHFEARKGLLAWANFKGQTRLENRADEREREIVRMTQSCVESLDLARLLSVQ